jgi:hypothetical protein
LGALVNTKTGKPGPLTRWSRDCQAAVFGTSCEIKKVNMGRQIAIAGVGKWVGILVVSNRL